MNALIPGSFDPITLGHVDIVERASKIFDKVYIAVMNNDSSKHDSRLSSKNYLFDMSQRMKIAQLSLAHINNVEIISSSGMLIDLCDELNTHIIVKGIRNGADLEYEMIHASWNKEHNDKVETLFLPCNEKLASVSSTVVREHIKKQDYEVLRRYISSDAVEYIRSLDIGGEI